MVELEGEGFADGEVEGAGDGEGGVPAGGGVGADGLAAHEDDLAMAEGAEMAEGELGAAVAVEDDVGDVGEIGVAGDEDGRKAGGGFEVGVDGEQAFDAAGVKELGVGADEVGAMAMVDGEVEEAFAEEEVAGAGEDLGVIGLAEDGKEDAYGLAALALEFAGDEAGLVVEVAGGGADALAGGFRDGAAGGVVEDEGDGGGAEAEVLGEELEAGARRGDDGGLGEALWHRAVWVRVSGGRAHQGCVAVPEGEGGVQVS